MTASGLHNPVLVGKDRRKPPLLTYLQSGCHWRIQAGGFLSRQEGDPISGLVSCVSAPAQAMTDMLAQTK